MKAATTFAAACGISGSAGLGNCQREPPIYSWERPRDTLSYKKKVGKGCHECKLFKKAVKRHACRGRKGFDARSVALQHPNVVRSNHDSHEACQAVASASRAAGLHPRDAANSERLRMSSNTFPTTLTTSPSKQPLASPSYDAKSATEANS